MCVCACAEDGGENGTTLVVGVWKLHSGAAVNVLLLLLNIIGVFGLHLNDPRWVEGICQWVRGDMLLMSCVRLVSATRWLQCCHGNCSIRVHAFRNVVCEGINLPDGAETVRTQFSCTGKPLLLVFLFAF